jgi:hypothetical protein
MYIKTRMAFQPALHLGVLVSGIVVDDQCHSFPPGITWSITRKTCNHSWWRWPSSHMLITVPSATLKAAKSVAPPVTLVIVSHRSAAALLQRQAGLGTVQRIHLAFFSLTHITMACSGGFKIEADACLPASRQSVCRC